MQGWQRRPPSRKSAVDTLDSLGYRTPFLMDKRFWLPFKITLTVSLLYLLYSKIAWPEFGRILQQANFFWIGVAVAVHFVTYLWSVKRWKIILENFRIHAPFWKLTKITFIGAFFGLFLPSIVGGDFFRAYYLARDQKRRLTTTLTSLILDRSAGFMALLAIGTTFAAIRSVSVQGVRIFPSVAAFTAVFLLANVIIFNHSLHRRLESLLRRRGMQRSVERLDAAVDGLKTLSANRSALVQALMISFGVQLAVVLIVWCIGLALRTSVPFVYFLIFVPLINLITMVPLTINGIGLREAVFYLLFSQVGMSREACISMGLLYYLVLVLTALPGGFLYSFYKKQDHLDESLHEMETS
ncbi:MAG: flippase-like domain-containing protein [Acidobacteria bacterium]|nr:flippase-like domain-containing protein [Acidobacteriota bacterium]